MSVEIYNFVTNIPGIKVGHAHNPEALTGCTVVLCEGGAVGGIDQRGGAPGTRESDLLRPMHLVEEVHAVFLSGGSAFGLDAAGGVMRYLEEHGIGFDTGAARVPIVPGAVLYDLGIGDPAIRPDARMGYQACRNASSDPPTEGNVGAGCGATVGKILGPENAMKSGIGTACIEIHEGLLVGAIIAVNALGDIIDPENMQIIAGARNPLSKTSVMDRGEFFANTLQVMKHLSGQSIFGSAPVQNTVIGVVATNARFTKEQVNMMAQMAQDGIARAIRPSHTMLDGDTIFSLATGDHEADINVVGGFAAEAVSLAILRAVRSAEPVAGLPSANSIGQ